MSFLDETFKHKGRAKENNNNNNNEHSTGPSMCTQSDLYKGTRPPHRHSLRSIRSANTFARPTCTVLDPGLVSKSLSVLCRNYVCVFNFCLTIHCTHRVRIGTYISFTCAYVCVFARVCVCVRNIEQREKTQREF